MMEGVIRVNGENADPVHGRASLDARKIIWRAPLILGSLILAPFYMTVSAVILFGVLSYVTLLLGHSVGMHRMMIHRSFRASKPLERALIYCGVLVGMGGPFDIIKTHDLRDWAQRQPKCHDYFSHKRGFIQDVFWQLFYRFDYDHPPRFTIEAGLANDVWLNMFQKTWPLHQAMLALGLYLIGGWPWVIWGVGVRVSISIMGHWTITHFCHNPGPGHWRVPSAGVQASNLKLPALIGGILTHGECWHNNHHAFPESARIGLYAGQIDPAWGVIRALERCGLIRDIRDPRPAQAQHDLTPQP